MNRTKIETVLNPDGTPGYTWNPITGCLNGCEYCYARKLANTRLKEKYLANKYGVAANEKSQSEYYDNRNDPFYPRFWPEKLEQIKRPPAPSDWYANNASMTIHPELQPPNTHAKRKAKGIFTCDMSDLFGIGIPEAWTKEVLSAIRTNSIDRFYLLTKQPQNLAKFSPFSDNCWVGVTATNAEMLLQACSAFEPVRAKLKYLSIEPFLDWSFNWNESYLINTFKRAGINLVIIGGQTRPTIHPKIEWIREIVEACDKAGIPVFLKNNLKPLFQPFMRVPNIAWWGNVFGLRQEVPKE